MSRRLCEDCGIAAWQDCVCDGDAGLDHPRNPYQAAEQRRGGWRLASKDEATEAADGSATTC